MADSADVIPQQAPRSGDDDTHAMSYRSLRGRIPALHPAQMEGLRQLFSNQVCWPLPGERMLTLNAAKSEQQLGGVFELEGDGQRMALRFGSGSSAMSTSPHWSDYQGRARLLAWSLNYESLLMQLSEAIGVALLPVEETAAERIQDSDSETLWLSFAIEDMYEPLGDDRPFHQAGTIRLPVHWLSRMLARSEPIDPDNPQPDLASWLQLPTRVSICCPAPDLSADVWAGLVPGDVIVLGHRSRPPSVFAKINGRQWPLTPHSDGWQINADMQTIPTLLENFAMTEHNPDAQADGATGIPATDAATRNLPILLEFELGRLELSMGELAGLQPGYVFALPAFVEGANVTLRANGRVSGRGEIVSVGDTLGVRLVSWS